MSRAAQNQGFTCQTCGEQVAPLTNGSYRNHCPRCLWSRHVDMTPGDRASECGAPMRPERIEHRKGKGLVIVHRCTACGALRPNRVADDVAQGDEIDAITAVMAGLPPWPRPRRIG